MKLTLNTPPLAAAAAFGLLLAGCGGTATRSVSGAASTRSPGALSADATSARTGDIPDNQNFLTFRDAGRGFSMVYPEGWTVLRSGAGVTFQDKNNLVRILLSSGNPPTAAEVQAQLATLHVTAAPQAVRLPGGTAIKAAYTAQSQPNPVTGKRVTLMVDRYALARNGRTATVDLGTPVGVDNVDAYKMMIGSFRWR